MTRKRKDVQPVDWDALTDDPNNVDPFAFWDVCVKHGISLKDSVTLADLSDDFWQEVLSECRHRLIALLRGEQPLSREDREFAAKLLEGAFEESRLRGRPRERFNELRLAEGFIRSYKIKLRSEGMRNGIHEAAVERYMHSHPDIDREKLENFLRRSNRKK